MFWFVRRTKQFDRLHVLARLSAKFKAWAGARDRGNAIGALAVAGRYEIVVALTPRCIDYAGLGSHFVSLSAALKPPRRAISSLAALTSMVRRRELVT